MMVAALKDFFSATKSSTHDKEEEGKKEGEEDVSRISSFCSPFSSSVSSPSAVSFPEFFEKFCCLHTTHKPWESGGVKKKPRWKAPKRK